MFYTKVKKSFSIEQKIVRDNRGNRGDRGCRVLLSHPITPIIPIAPIFCLKTQKLKNF